MPKIIFKGIIKSEDDFPSAIIPENAKKLNVEEDMKKMQIKALPFMIPSVLILLMCMFLKTFIEREIVVNFWFIFIGFIIGFFLLIVHELLHAIVFPKNAIVYIGFVPKSLSPVALSSSPVKRNRYILLSLLPLILGIIPLTIFCFSSVDLKELNGLMFGISIMGMLSIYPDIYNVFNILRYVPKNATIQNDKNTTYYFE